MPVKNFLTQEQKENLQNALKESEDKYFRQRALMLLLMNDGKTYAEITDFLGCSYRSVAYWCCHGQFFLMTEFFGSLVEFSHNLA